MLPDGSQHIPVKGIISVQVRLDQIRSGERAVQPQRRAEEEGKGEGTTHLPRPARWPACCCGPNPPAPPPLQRPPPQRPPPQRPPPPAPAAANSYRHRRSSLPPLRLDRALGCPGGARWLGLVAAGGRRRGRRWRACRAVR